jgi:1-deoxy-D-xylulose-5-phosphate synthase
VIKINILNKIHSPKDLKSLKPNELEILVKEIREFLVASISKTGGHLSSNLGVTELTVALHYCFDSPADKIIFDVGHQSYTHKILTGRKDRFDTLRQYGGLSGFPKPNESEHDVFGTGHASTAISAALGMAKSRDIQGLSHHVVAVVGDGSLTGGMAFEGLNDAGSSQTDLLVILNDNQMSISKNVGAMSRYLNEIRTARSYIGAKSGVRGFLGKIPAVGGWIGKVIKKIKKMMRYVFFSGVLFEEMGFRYIGPIDGNSLTEMVLVLNNIKRIKGPVLLHVCTQKGKGYFLAENSPSVYHGVESFKIETGEPLESKSGGSFTEVFGRKIVELAQNDKRIAAVTAAMPHGTGLSEFAARYPDRFFDVGIAEGHAVTFAAGMAATGMKPVVAVYSSFLQRAYDQILHDVCLQNLPVVFAVDRSGIVGADGETHQGVFDLSFLGHIPNITVFAPKDGAELEEMLEHALNMNAPCVIRYPRDAVKTHADADTEKYGKICLVSVGNMYGTAVSVKRRLETEGIRVDLADARRVKPIDGGLTDSLHKYEYVFTLEDNVIGGGFGMNLLAALNETANPPKVKIFAFPCEFIKQGSREDLLREYGLDDEGVYTAIKAALGGKGGTNDS